MNNQNYPDSFYKGFIALFASHKVAANLLMVFMVVAGLYSLSNLSRQMFPDFDFDYIVISTVWVGASPEDVESAITSPIEREIKDVDGIKNLNSYSKFGFSRIVIELQDGTDLLKTVDDVRQRVDAIQNLPEMAEQTVVQRLDTFSDAFNILVYTDGPEEELLGIVRQIENGLLNVGVRNVDLEALPEYELAVQVGRSNLERLGLSLSDVGQKIINSNIDQPAGTAGRQSGRHLVRIENESVSVEKFNLIPLINEGNRIVTLGDVAIITKQLKDDADYITFNGKKAVVIQLRGADREDIIKMSDVSKTWLSEFQSKLPEGVHLIQYLEKWELIRDRIATLVNNAGSGLILIFVVLFLFLNARVAFWVGAGVPIALLGTMALLYAFGGSINLISLLGLLVALGIVVDDAIVVGEESLTQYQNGVPAREAAIIGARRMLVPVLASSLTTIAAFLPTAMFGGAMGKIIIDIPFIIVCILIASIIECFFILPGHLHHSLSKMDKEPSAFRRWFEQKFKAFTHRLFLPSLKFFLRFRLPTVIGAILLLIISIFTVSTGFLKWNFFPAADTSDLRAKFQLVPGSTEAQANAFLNHLQQTLNETNDDLGGDIVEFSYKHHRVAAGFNTLGGSLSNEDPAYGTLVVETNVGDHRSLSNDEFIEQWRQRITIPPGMDEFSIGKSPVGPPGKDLEFFLIHHDPLVLKTAALALQEELAAYQGVENITDDMPWGNEQFILSLNAKGLSQGLTLADLGSQVNAALDGILIQQLNDGPEEIDVRVRLPDSERLSMGQLFNVPIKLPAGEIMSFSDVANIEIKQGFQQLPRDNAQRAILVQADVDMRRNNAFEIFAELEESVFPMLEKKYSVLHKPAGNLRDNAQLQKEMQSGAIMAFVIMYIILAWVFSSYTWPFVIMSAIFLGLSGAILGHVIVIKSGLLDISFSFLSAIGMFGLAGIIVNDSIILASFVKERLEAGVSAYESVIQACEKRLRPVILTSVTTIVGLIPILFEGSVQAQFLKPMVVSIAFGLLFGTVLILIVVPCLLLIIEGDFSKKKS